MIFVRDLSPKILTSFKFVIISASDNEPAILLTGYPSSLNFEDAEEWIFSSNRVLILFLGKEVLITVLYDGI